MALYKEHTLQDWDSIRVLMLQPGDSDADIEVSVTTLRLSTNPNFNALSYTWGNPVDEQHPSYREYDKDKYHVLYAGERLAVFQNLHEALWQLREKQVYSPIWIDAICIDQNNIEERNHQLSLMPRIYCGASWTLIWLGKDDLTTLEAVQCLDDSSRNDIFGTQSTGFHESAITFLGSIPRRKRQAFNLLLRRRWFDRVWTLQEVLLPQRTRCLCGPHELDISAATAFAANLLSIASSGLVTSDILRDELPTRQLINAACVLAWLGLTWPSGGFGGRAFLRFPRIDHKLQLSRTFKWLVALELFVHEVRQRNCCDLKDKVLAPLAFALHDKFVPRTPEFLSAEKQARYLIDFRIPVTDLYLRFTRFMIKSTANLDILSRAHRDVPRDDAIEELNLPSWVPPFHNAGTTSLIDNLLYTRYNAASFSGLYRVVESEQSLFSFRQGLTRKSIGRAEAPELPAQAVFFGTIDQISTHSAPADTTCAWLEFVRNSDRFKQEAELGHNSDLAHAVIRDSGDRLANGLQRETKSRDDFQEFLRFHMSTVALIQLNTTVSL